MSNYDFITFDFETANSNNDSACALGLVFVKDLEIVGSKYFLIKPPTDKFEPKNIQTHGITYKDVKNSPDFKEVWKQVLPLLKQTLLIAHNAHFDMSVILTCCENFGIKAPYLDYFDSISLFSSAFPGHKNKSLDYCADILDVPLANHHHALDDAKACAEIAIKSLQQIESLPLKYKMEAYQKIKINNSYETIAIKEFHTPKFAGKKIKITEITPTSEEFCNQHPFFQKIVVFTGDLISFDRKEAMQSVVDLGGLLRTSVSKKTNFVVFGTPPEPGYKTAKEIKALELIEQGHEIKLLSEEEFLQILNT